MVTRVSIWEASLNYDRTFVNKHAVSAMLLFNRRHYDDGAALPYRNRGWQDVLPIRIMVGM